MYGADLKKQRDTLSLKTGGQQKSPKRSRSKSNDALQSKSRSHTPLKRTPPRSRSASPVKLSAGEEISNLRSRIAFLEEREINQDEQNEMMETKQKHSKIAVNQEIKQLKQHVVYLDRIISEKDHLLQATHNELQSIKYDVNKQGKDH